MKTQEDIDSNLDLASRTRRYHRLRSAQRALRPSVRDPNGLPHESRFRSLRGQLRALTPESANSELLRNGVAEIDRELDAIAEQLRARLSEISIGQLRAVLPSLCRSHRDEVGALLDLCLENETYLPRYWNLVDYLVTLLATAEDAGIRRLVTDPSSVTSRMQDVCAEFEAKGTDPAADLESSFRQAAISLQESRGIDPVVREMRTFKREFSEKLLYPNVLRGVVEYNVAVWNRMETLIQIDRDEDAADRRAVEQVREDESVESKDVTARVRRYHRLRCALRALRPSVRDTNQLPADDRFKTLRGRIQDLSSRLADHADESDDTLLQHNRNQLDQIDAGLDAIANELRGKLIEVPFGQLRATLPSLCQSHRDEVAALLDLCIEDETELPQYWSLADYLISLLATDEKDGIRFICGDPDHATELLHELSMRCGEVADEHALEIESAFKKATTSLHHAASIESIVPEMRALKEKYSDNLLAPSTLRAIVEYNIAVWNRMQTLIQIDRDLEEAEFGEDNPERAAEPVHEAHTGSVFDAPVVDELVRALATRVRGEELEEGPIAKLIDRFNFAMLASWERDALLDESDDPSSVKVRVAIAVGFAASKVPELEIEVVAVGLELDTLMNEWVPEAQQGLAGLIQKMIVSGDENAYEQARHFSETKTKYVPAWLKQSEGEEGDDAGHDVYGPVEVVELVESSPKRRWLGMAAASLAVSILIFFGWSYFSPKGVTRSMSRDQLTAISPYLESGHRNGLGLGPVASATFNEDWTTMPRDKRRIQAELIEKRLGGVGIKEAMFFNARGGLAVHISRGKLRYPPAPKEPEPSS